MVLEPRTARQLRHPEKQARPDTPILRKPEWLRVRAPGSPGYAATRAIVREHGLVTVCEEAGCPNIGECWEKSHATMMIMGEVCTRACGFCNVATGKPGPLDPTEPARVAEAVARMGLKHVVITSVDRDDLADGGAAHFAATVAAIRAAAPGATIEILTPDFLTQARRGGDRHRRATRRLQPQPGDRAAALSRHPAGRPLLRLAAAAGTRQGAGPGPVHQVGPDGRPRRGEGRSAAGDGRHALRRRRLHHHRPVSAALAQARRRSTGSGRRTSSRRWRRSRIRRAS